MYDVRMILELPAAVFNTGRGNLRHTFLPDKSIAGSVEAFFRPTHKAARPELLSEFRLLAGAKDETILRFAKTWGVLRIDRKGRFRSRAKEGREPLHFWRDLSGRIAAILRIAADLKRGGSGRLEDWQTLRFRLGSTLENAPGPAENPAWDARGVRQARLRLERELDDWLSRWGPRLAVRGGTVALDGGGHLLSALAVQLVGAALHGRLYVCDECHEPYIRKGRSPRRGEENFCPACGVRAAWRKASRRRLERRKHPAEQ